MEEKAHNAALSPGDLPPSSWNLSSFQAGALALAPVTVGVIPFGVVTGVLSVSVGIAPRDSWIMSMVMVSGAAQVAMMDLMARNASVAVIIVTGLIINLRFLMYSASLGPYLRGVPALRKGVLSYMLTDQAFAVSMVEFQRPGSTVHKVSYYAGAALLMYVVWMGSVISGILLGTAIPPSWQLDFAVPLTFLALLAPSIRDRSYVFAALTAAAASVLASGLPSGLGLLVGAALGIGAGFYLSRGKQRQKTAAGGGQ